MQLKDTESAKVLARFREAREERRIRRAISAVALTLAAAFALLAWRKLRQTFRRRSAPA